MRKKHRYPTSRGARHASQNDEEDVREMSLGGENRLLSQTVPSRVSPGIFIQIPAAIDALGEESNMSTKPDRRGIPALPISDMGREEYRTLEILYGTGVAKRKSKMEFRGILCARGGCRRPDVPLDYSAPTASRCSPPFSVSLTVSMNLVIGVLDVWSAFIQRD